MSKHEHEGGMRPTGWRLPMGIVLVSGVLSAAVIGGTYGALPILPWTMIPTLGLLALGEAVAAYHTRRRIRRAPGTVPVQALAAARLVALAKASILLGALAVGVFGGFAVVLLDRLHAAAARADALTALATAGTGALLLAAGVYLEYACRVPEDDESDPSQPA